MSFRGNHPEAYKAAIDALELGPTMRNTQFPGSDTDAYANPRDESAHTCSVPLDYNSFKWKRDGDHTLLIAGRSFQGVLNQAHAGYVDALQKAEKDQKLYGPIKFTKQDGNPYTESPFSDYKWDDSKYQYLNRKTICDVGVQLAPWKAAEGETGQPGTTSFSVPTPPGSRFAYDGACYPPPHCGC